MTVYAPPLADLKPPREKTRPLAPVRDWWLEVVEDRAALERHEAAWDRLAKEAIEPNVFYEPWMFLPQVRAIDPDRALAAVFIYRHDARPKQPPQLCGFFPLERRRRFRGLPIRSLRLWSDDYTVLGAPLLHRDWSRETLHQLFDWIARDERPALLECPRIPAEGPFWHALTDVLNERRLLSVADESFNRALLRRGLDAESYCAAAMNRLSRKEWRRQRKRLSELGKLEARVLSCDDDASRWIEQFLALEASGWKGQAHTALAHSDAARGYFRAIATAGFARGQLQMLGIFLDDRPIALKCNFLTGDGGFAFKIAFDEAYAKYSPGVQLELDNIEELHRRPELQWMDSCAIPGHQMINRLWKDRRAIQHLLIATSRFTGNAVVGMLPMLRAVKRMLPK